MPTPQSATSEGEKVRGNPLRLGGLSGATLAPHSEPTTCAPAGRGQPVSSAARFRPEQPSVDVVRDRLEPRVGDPLPVVPSHRGVGVAHNQVSGGLVLGLVRDGPENMTQRVETTPAAVDPEPAE